jgi:uncharacterized protein (DUF362 family)
MNFEHSMTRRESIKKLLGLWGGLSLGTAAIVSLPGIRPASASAGSAPFLVDGVGQSEGYSVRDLTRKTFDAAGGMRKFVSRGDVVAIKPNISWARAPHLAATTNPEVLEAVIELCQEAGAKKVRIVDHTIHGAKRCFAITGAGLAAKNTDADLVHPRSSLMRDMKIGGNRLEVWPVFTPVVEADTLINLPVAKSHSLSRLTLGMKNWIGAVGGRRNALHQDIHQTIVDLAHFFDPDVTLIDATRVMVRNGPSGGSPSDVKVMNRLILSNDPVAADARAARLFDLEPDRVGFIKIGRQQGLGNLDIEISAQLEVTV